MIVNRTSTAAWRRDRDASPVVARGWAVADGSSAGGDLATNESAAGYAGGLKRGLDVLISILALAAFLPVLAGLALAIKLDSRGPVFFLQSRIGIDRRQRQVPYGPFCERRRVINPGRPFRIFKLRTMSQDAEASGPRWATVHDARVTRVGRFLRKLRLDEFPQFVNVLRGEMSVIGPRPERLCFIYRLVPVVHGYRERLDVLPGITGLAQVVNGYDTDVASVRRKVALDRQYIDNLCLWADLVILARTCKVLRSGDGAH